MTFIKIDSIIDLNFFAVDVNLAEVEIHSNRAFHLANKVTFTKSAEMEQPHPAPGKFTGLQHTQCVALAVAFVQSSTNCIAQVMGVTRNSIRLMGIGTGARALPFELTLVFILVSCSSE